MKTKYKKKKTKKNHLNIEKKPRKWTQSSKISSKDDFPSENRKEKSLLTHKKNRHKK